MTEIEAIVIEISITEKRRESKRGIRGKNWKDISSLVGRAERCGWNAKTNVSACCYV